MIAIGLQLTTISALKHLGHEVGLPPPGLYLLNFVIVCTAVVLVENNFLFKLSGFFYQLGFFSVELFQCYMVSLLLSLHSILIINSFGMVFATLVQYFCDVPAADAVMFLGVPISGKIFTYSIALQV